MSHFKKKKEGKLCVAPGISHTSQQYIKPQLKTSPAAGWVEGELVNAPLISLRMCDVGSEGVPQTLRVTLKP